MSFLTKFFMLFVSGALLLAGTEKNLQLPNFTKWADNDQWCASEAFYKGREVVIMDRRYIGPFASVVLYSRPMSIEVLKQLGLGNEDRSKNEDRIKEILAQNDEDFKLFWEKKFGIKVKD